MPLMAKTTKAHGATPSARRKTSLMTLPANWMTAPPWPGARPRWNWSPPQMRATR